MVLKIPQTTHIAVDTIHSLDSVCCLSKAQVSGSDSAEMNSVCLCVQLETSQQMLSKREGLQGSGRRQSNSGSWWGWELYFYSPSVGERE